MLSMQSITCPHSRGVMASVCRWLPILNPTQFERTLRLLHFMELRTYTHKFMQQHYHHFSFSLELYLVTINSITNSFIKQHSLNTKNSKTRFVMLQVVPDIRNPSTQKSDMRK